MSKFQAVCFGSRYRLYWHYLYLRLRPLLVRDGVDGKTGAKAQVYRWA